MCYLIAKHIDDVGCVALKTTHGEHLSKLKRAIEAIVEYEPYHFVSTAEEFKQLVLTM